MPMLSLEKRKLNFADKVAIQDLAQKGVGCTEISRTLGIHGQQVAGYVRTLINFGASELNPQPAPFQKGPPYAMWGPPPPRPAPAPCFATQRPFISRPKMEPMPPLDAPLEARTLRNELASVRSAMAGVAAELRRLSNEIARMNSRENEALLRAIIRLSPAKESVEP